jgi:methionyl-tRNA synthetase
VPANEFYNLQGRKFNTSEGWTLPIDRFLERYDAESTRFHLLLSMPETADADWRWEDFQRSVGLLADTLGNLVTRVLRFAAKNWDGRIPPLSREHAEELDRILLTECGPIADPAVSVQAFRFRRAAEELLGNASAANVFVDRLAPWTLRKTDPARAASVLHTAASWLGWLARWMVPFMPGRAQALWGMLGQAGKWRSSGGRGCQGRARGAGWMTGGRWARSRGCSPSSRMRRWRRRSRRWRSGRRARGQARRAEGSGWRRRQGFGAVERVPLWGGAAKSKKP